MSEGSPTGGTGKKWMQVLHVFTLVVVILGTIWTAHKVNSVASIHTTDTQTAKQPGTATSSAWKEAFQKAKELRAKKSPSDASYYLINALNKSPGHIDIINEYTDVIKGLAEEKKKAGFPEEAAAQLAGLESVLNMQVQFVDPGNVEAILKKIKEVRGWESESPTEGMARPQGPKDPPKDGLVGKIRGFVSGSKPSTTGKKSGDEGSNPPNGNPSESLESLLAVGIDKDLRVVKKHLEKLSDLRDNERLTEEVGRKVDQRISLLQNHITVVKICEQAKTNLAQTSKLLEQTDKAPLVPYSLQQAENLLREATGLADSLASDGEVQTRDRETITILLDDIRKKSQDASKAISEKEWTKFLIDKKVDALLESARKIDCNCLDRQDNKSIQIGREVKGECQKKIEELKGLIQGFEDIMPKLVHPEVAKKAKDKLTDIASLLDRLSMQQQKCYASWALLAAESCLAESDKYLSNVPYRTKTKDIELCIIKYLGEIDVRYLPADVQRSYSEVYEYLFSKLDSPTSGEATAKSDPASVGSGKVSVARAFADPGNKLHLLKELSTRPKRSLSYY